MFKFYTNAGQATRRGQRACPSASAPGQRARHRRLLVFCMYLVCMYILCIFAYVVAFVCIFCYAVATLLKYILYSVNIFVLYWIIGLLPLSLIQCLALESTTIHAPGSNRPWCLDRWAWKMYRWRALIPKYTPQIIKSMELSPNYHLCSIQIMQQVCALRV